MAQQTNPLLPHLINAQEAAVDSQKRLIQYMDNQINNLSKALKSATAEKEAFQKETLSLRQEILRLQEPADDPADNIVEEVVEEVDEN